MDIELCAARKFEPEARSLSIHRVLISRHSNVGAKWFSAGRADWPVRRHRREIRAHEQERRAHQPRRQLRSRLLRGPFAYENVSIPGEVWLLVPAPWKRASQHFARSVFS